MRIYIFSTQIEIGQVICDHLTSSGNHCYQFPTTETLAESLKSLKTFPDLLILDYTTFNHELFNVRTYFNESNIQLPVVFYNDPCITKATRAKHWLSQIKLLQKLPEIKDFSKYEPVFSELQKVIEDKNISPFVKLMTDPKPIPNYLIKKTLNLENIKNELDDKINDLKEKIDLPKNLYYLLELFHKNKSIPLSLSDLINLYKKDNKNVTETSLKVLISQLRSKIKKDLSYNFTIINERGLYCFVKKSKI